MKYKVELAERTRLNLSKQTARLDVVGKLQRRQVFTSPRASGEIRNDDVRATAPVELPHQRAADKTGAAGDQDAFLPPKILIFVDVGHGSDVTRISDVFHLSALISSSTVGLLFRSPCSMNLNFVLSKQYTNQTD
jgi:hypothetical protein